MSSKTDFNKFLDGLKPITVVNLLFYEPDKELDLFVIRPTFFIGIDERGRGNPERGQLLQQRRTVREARKLTRKVRGPWNAFLMTANQGNVLCTKPIRRQKSKRILD